MREYHIPTNFKDAGYIFNGMIAVRSAVDAVIMGLIGFFIASLLPFKGDSAISGYILIVGLFAMVGFSGIRGIPVSVFIVNAIKWRGRRKPYLYNHHGRSYSMTAAELMLTEPQLRNKVADVLDKIKDSMASKRLEYVEGETFKFAEDPELEALQYAEEQLCANTVAQTQKAGEDTEPEPPVAKTEIDFDQIADSIILQDIKED